MGHIDGRSSHYEKEPRHFWTLRILVLFLHKRPFCWSYGSWSLGVNNYEGLLEILKNISQAADQLTFLTQKLAAYSLQTVHPLVLLENMIWS